MEQGSKAVALGSTQEGAGLLVSPRAPNYTRSCNLSRYAVTNPLRILVVEDDPDVLASIAAVLRDEDGFAVWGARDGEQAMEVADELGFDADVLVVDLNLGPGNARRSACSRVPP
jgi:PleD family two-component response regulator